MRIKYRYQQDATLVGKENEKERARLWQKIACTMRCTRYFCTIKQPEDLPRHESDPAVVKLLLDKITNTY